MINKNRYRIRYWVCLSVLSQTIALGGAAAAASSDEDQSGAQAYREVEEQIGIYKGQFLANYVDAVGRRLAASLDDPPYRFRFKIVDRPEPNTFALPGGHIYVSRGILAQINSEAELAGLLAHEIGHVILEHQVQHASLDNMPGLLTLPGQDVGTIVGDDLGNLINAPLGAAGRVSLFAYSHSQESEADRAGIGLAAKAGYDPAAFGKVLDSLDQLLVLTGGREASSFYKSIRPRLPGLKTSMR